MAELCQDPIEARLESLLRVFGIRQWQRPFNHSDVTQLIQCHPRLVAAVVDRGVQRMWFLLRGTEYTLTRQGKARIQELKSSDAAQGLQNQRVNESSVSGDSRKPESVTTAAPVDDSTEKPRDNATLRDSRKPESVSIDYATQNVHEKLNDNATLTAASGSGSGGLLRRVSDGGIPESYFPKGKAGLEFHSYPVSRSPDLDPDQIRSQIPDPRARSNFNADSYAKAAAADLIRATREAPNRNARVTDSEDRARAFAVAQTFASLRQIHGNWGAPVQLAAIGPGNREYTCLLKAAANAEALGVTYDVYVKAQFYWFDKWFNREPRVWELVSSDDADHKMPATERVRAYLREIAKGTVDPQRNIYGHARTSPKIPVAVLLQHGDRTLKRLMEVHNATEEQILLTFAKGSSAQHYFDRSWLKQNETYQRLRKENRL